MEDISKKEQQEKLNQSIKEEIKEYVDDVKAKDIEIYDEKPAVQKIVFILLGLTNFLAGFALYFLIRDDKKKKWQASYLCKSSAVGCVLVVVIAILEFIFGFIDGLIFG